VVNRFVVESQKDGPKIRIGGERILDHGLEGVTGFHREDGVELEVRMSGYCISDHILFAREILDDKVIFLHLFHPTSLSSREFGLFREVL
jgi:hypothetical protein